MLFAPKEKAQGLVEYAIILSLVAILVIAIVRVMGARIGETYSTINSSLP
jgi:pilus assembly protein Flp/PilA